MRSNLVKIRGNKSRQEVAEVLDITPQMLGAIERGTRNPSLSLAKRISDFYGTSIEVLFFEESGHELCLKKK